MTQVTLCGSLLVISIDSTLLWILIFTVGACSTIAGFRSRLCCQCKNSYFNVKTRIFASYATPCLSHLFIWVQWPFFSRSCYRMFNLIGAELQLPFCPQPNGKSIQHHTNLLNEWLEHSVQQSLNWWHFTPLCDRPQVGLCFQRSFSFLAVSELEDPASDRTVSLNSNRDCRVLFETQNQLFIQTE